ncbi:MAG: UPF0182 family protein [Clostridia bacterium]|nr:UPF0182 family protein [Clostridia bacterium]
MIVTNNNNFYETQSKRKAVKTLLAVIFAAILSVCCFVGFKILIGYYEVREIGENFVSSYFKDIFAELIVIASVGLISFLIAGINTFVAKNKLAKIGINNEFTGKKLKGFLLILVASLAFAVVTQGDMHKELLLASNSVSFNVLDPIFYMDISYYVFSRPFIMSVLGNLSLLIVFTTVYVFVLYCSQYLKFGERTFVDMAKEKGIVSHIAFNIILLMLIGAFTTILRAQDVLTAEFAGLTGGGFTDVNIVLNYHRTVPVLIVVVMILTVVFLKKNKLKHALICVASYIILSVLVNFVALGVDVFYVSPNEIAVESKYIQYNMDYTKKAYGLDNVIETEYAVNTSATKESVLSNGDTIENIRVIDFAAALTATNQLQGLRNYYEFKDLDVGVYNIDGKEKAVALGAREIQKENLDKSAKNYINEKFRYTHGYGAVMMSFNQVTPQGEPYYYIKDIKQPNSGSIPKINQPRVYFGQLDNDEVIVNTKTREIDYSEGEIDNEFDYDGDAGIKLTPLNRALFALKTGDFRMIIANQITSESRLLINTNVLDRVEKVAPFLSLNPDPQLIIDDDGSMKWVIDGFTKTDKYPYAQMTGEYNYIRNSVKAVVDAYTGKVKIYIIDKTDPIIMAYKSIYPYLFAAEDIPESIMSKSVYPETLFNVQCKIYAQYHTQRPETFYNKNDLYTIANEKYEDEIRPVSAYYNLIQLDEYNKNGSELVLMLPYTLYNRENMVSWIAVGNKGDNYGKFVSYKFPQNINIYGPLQIENLIDNDPEISKELTLWNSGGSKVIRGNLMVIPVNGTILYIEPVYLTSDNQASIPAVKRVIAACGNKIVMEETIQKALAKLFETTINIEISDENYVPEDIGDSEDEIPYVTDETIQKIIESYEKLEQSASSSDWKNFGESMNEMKEAVSELKGKNAQNEE